MAKAIPPATMRAWQYTSNRGGIEKNLKLNSSAPVPKPKSDVHLVQILATALNPVDYKPAEIPVVGHLLTGSSATPGLDYAGVIVTPADGSPLKPGQLVFGVSALQGQSPIAGKAMAEYALVQNDRAIPIPDGVSTVEASTLGVAALTAYQSIVPRVKEGDRIFINGGSGGTGTFGIQMAKIVGCHVTTTCSTPNVELCKSLGADVVIDYKKSNVLETLLASEKFDLAIDNVGSLHDKAFWWRCNEYMKPGAAYVLVAGELSFGSLMDMTKRNFIPKFLGGLKGRVDGFFPEPKPADLERVAQWVKERKIKVCIDEIYPFDEGAKAFAKLKTGRAKGKIVIDVALETYKQAWE